MIHLESHQVEFSAAYPETVAAGRVRWHGHNFVVRVGFHGRLDSTGVIAPLSQLERAARHAVEPFERADLSAVLPPEPDYLLALAEAIHTGLRCSLPSDVSVSRLDVQWAAGGLSLAGGKWLYRHHGAFSAAHRTHAPGLGDAENRALYGICNNPAGHGHNYRAVIWHPASDGAPPAMWAEFDHRNLSVDIPDLRGRNVVTEAIAALLADRVPGASRVRVWETPDFFADCLPGEQHYRLGRLYRLSAAHHGGLASLTEADNLARFGPCGRPGIHGHDFIVLVVVSSLLDPRTEAAYDLGALDQAVSMHLEPLRQANLSADVSDLAGRAATPGELSAFLYSILARQLGAALCAVSVSAVPRQWSWTAKGDYGQESD